MYQRLACSFELSRMLRGARYSRPEIEDVSRESMTHMLAYAKRYCGFYAECMNATRAPLDAPLEVLRGLPVLTKEVLRSEVSHLRSSRWRLFVKENTSGGSTGEPAIFYQDARYRRWNRAAKLLFDRWSGVRLNHRKAILWAAQADARRGSRGKEWLKTILKNHLMLNAYKMDRASMSSYLDILERERPEQLLVYAESGYELARFALSQGRRLQGILAVMSSAGTLFPDMRATMEEAFGAPVFDRYGSREVGDIACECSGHAGLHVNPYTHYVEILREDGSQADPGELGHVVVTSLTNFAMPLIRYEIGDLACWASRDCPCGCKWPLLEKVEGRVTDHLRLGDGTLIYGGELRRLLYEVSAIKKYQWVQESLGEVRLSVVLDLSASVDHERWKKDLARLESQVQTVLGAQCRLTVDVVAGIPPSGSGKHRYVISKL